MRRFLDWTAAQTAGSNNGNSNSNSNIQQQQQQQQQQQLISTNNRRNSTQTAGQQQQLLYQYHHHHHQQHYQQQQQTISSSSSGGGGGGGGGNANPARELEIQHLAKLLHEIKYYQASSSPLPSVAGSQGQREFVEKVHRTLPLFLNVFGTSNYALAGNQPHHHQQPATPTRTGSVQSSSSFVLLTENQQQLFSASGIDPSIDGSPKFNSESNTTASSSSKPNSPLPPRSPQMDRFPDLLPFAFTIARLFVSEVRQRASNKHAEDASVAILQFLNPKPLQQQPPASGSEVSLEVTGQQQQQDQSSNVYETSQGWNLLMSLNTLALSQSSQIIQLLCDASLPSTLIKCLYLFFDLPVIATTTNVAIKQQPQQQSNDDQERSEIKEKVGADSSNTREVININCAPLIKAFTQLLVQLCSNQAAIDELIKKDDLRLLIGIASSQCSRHNRPWRKTAFQTLLAISRNMRDNFMYLEQNICIQIYIENLYRINSLGLTTTDEFIDMIRTLLEFLYNLDANNRNQLRLIGPLIEQFKSSRIIELIEELILKIDETIMQENQSSLSPASCGGDATSDSAKCPMSQQPSVCSEIGVCVDEFRRYGRRLMQSMTIMAKINVSPEAMTSIMTLKPLTVSRFEMFEQFKMPRPSARNCILNYEVIRLLKMAWSKCRDSHLIESVLDATISLFNDDKYNYFIFESQQLLVYYMTSYNFKLFPYKVKQKLFKFLEFIIIETNYIPCLELGTLGTIIKKRTSSDVDLILGLKTLIACLRFNSKFSDIFREIGLLEVIIELLTQTMQQDKLKQNTDKLEVLYLILEASQHLLAGPNNLNCTQFNESGAARHVFNCLSKPEFFHLFVPAHSSSSDDCGAQTASVIETRGESSPTVLMAHVKTKPSHITILQHHHSHLSGQWSETALNTAMINQNKPSIKQLQKVAFTIIRQLILSTAGDEHLANLLGLLARNLDDLKNLDSSDKQSDGNSNSHEDKDTAKDFEDNEVNKSQLSILNLTFLVSQEVNLKICILKSLMIVLKDSHRCRTLFRKAGGFIYIVSSLVILEKALPTYELSLSEKEAGLPQNTWRRVNARRIWRLIKNSLMTIVVAIRFEPANLRAFSDDVLEKFTEAIRNLGCFKTNQYSLEKSTHVGEDWINNFNSFKSIFLAPPTRDFSTIANDSIRPNEACCQLFRFLYDMALDMRDGTAELEISLERQGLVHKSINQTGSSDIKSISFDQESSSTSQYMTSTGRESNIYKRRSQLHMAPKRPPSLDLNTKNSDTAILSFPCIIMSILDLIPSCPNDDLMLFTSLIVRSLFKHERNQQLLCEAGLISKLLSLNWRIAIIDKSHFLYETTEFMFEKLTKQAVTAKELRIFLRLGDPLRCKNLDEIEVTESCDETREKLSAESKQLQESPITPIKPLEEKITTSRIEALVSMMSNAKSKPEPPFVEFDMSTDGFSSIFMPSIAPINVKSLPPNASSFLNSTLDVHANEKNGILGGVGLIERQFPPTTGITFSTWICIEKFPSRSSDATHNLRLLTIYRGSAATGKEYSCFRMQISALDRALTISTQESLLFDNDNRSDAQSDPDCNLRIWTPDLLVEGKWHHIAVTINKSSSKLSRIQVYVDGVLAHHQRICYISNYVGSTNLGALGNLPASSSSFSAAAFVNAFIGTLPQFRFQLKTQWKQGPCHLIEDALSANFIAVIYALGPNFIGNFQSSYKLNELAKTKGNVHQQAQYDLSKYHQQASAEVTPSHRPLIHQQSAAVVGSSVTHAQNPQLTRVSSSSFGSQSPSASPSNQSQQSASSSSHSHFNLAEDRVLMSIDARATSLMTLSRMRRIYTRFDCRQVSRVLGLALHENSIPILLLHNTGVHLNGPSRGVGAVTIGYNHVRCFVPSPTQNTLFNLGGSYILLGLVAQAQTVESFSISLRALVCALKYNTKLQAQMDNINGYQILSVLFWKKKHLLTADTLKLTFSLITDTPRNYVHNQVGQYLHQHGYHDENTFSVQEVQQMGALRELICECFDLWLQTDMIDLVLEFIHNLISSTTNQTDPTLANPIPSAVSSSTRVKNLKCFRDMDLLPRMLRLLPQYDPQQIDSNSETDLEINKCSMLTSIIREDTEDTQINQEFLSARTFDTKAVYLIKQTVFELLNRTPRQSDILYFGQFLASLLPSSNKERSLQSISLRNILLKSLLQMMTKNKQSEVNNAIQEELVRILGFDWFMLFISGSHLDSETITIGFLNMMIILSNDELYASFKSRSNTNGGWLKEPTFPTMDGKFNIQLLGINVGVFFGLSGKRKSIKQDVLDAPNFFLLINCLTDLVELPRTYLMIFLTMMSRFNKLESSVLDSIQGFDKLNLDILCDCLVGDTHHKRRQTLAGIQFKCHELIVCLVYMIGKTMSQYEKSNNSSEMTPGNGSPEKKHDEYPTDVVRFLMYLYNNNQEFQDFCRRSDELITALSESLIRPNPLAEKTSPLTPRLVDGSPNNSTKRKTLKLMTKHPASKEVLELSRLIILDTMTDQSLATNEPNGSNVDQLHAFEKFLESLSACKEAQGELVDMLLRQVLLMIDSTARHNSIKTIGSCDNVLQFQLLLINSIAISQIVTDKIWLNELYTDSLSRISNVIDHQLCLAEQIFKFNAILPKHNPPHAFIMQRVLNRIILFALSRPMQHMSDKMLMLEILKKIYDNRTIIILNHMHSPQSAEFFVCFAYCLMNIIEDNTIQTSVSSGHFNNNFGQQSLPLDSQPASLIERQYGHPSLSGLTGNITNKNEPSSSALMLVSLARKVWDAIYQSKKGILSEAFDVSLSLPAFTLETSLDLIQLKPDIKEACERYWTAFIEAEQRPKSRLQQRQSEPAPGNTATSTAVNILSGRLTRVVNAASFVSRVVGATAGTMASNVNLVGEKLTQTRSSRREMPARCSSDSIGASQTAVLTSSPVGQNQTSSYQSGLITDQDELFKCPNLSKSQLDEAAQTHISIIGDYILGQMSQKNHKLALHKYLCDEWLDTEYEILLRERALFGPDYGSNLDKWCLDMTEGPRRMRKKMVNNSRQFYKNYPYRPEQYNPSNKSLRYRPPMSYDSHLYYMKTLDLDDHLLEFNDSKSIAIADAGSTLSVDKKVSLENSYVEDEPSTPTRSTVLSPSSVQQQNSTPTKNLEPIQEKSQRQQQLQSSPAINVDSPSPIKSVLECHSSIESLASSVANNRLGCEPCSPRPSERDIDDGDSTSFVDFSPEIEAETNLARESENIDSLSVLRLLEKNERISHMFRCSRVQGLDTHEGLLLFGREHFYLIDGFTLLKTREIKDIDSLPPDGHDPIIPNSTPNIMAHSRKTCAKFSFDSIVEVHKRRYLLQPIALEVFSSDGRNTLIVFPRNIRNKVYSRLMTVSTQLTNNAHESLAGQKSNVSVEGGSGLLSNLIGETSVTQRWVRGELSNFQYLMNLNTIAGRSYNDLMQYPIFPWILADYTSNYLDLTKPSTFRDLSRPVGAQTSERLEQFKRRYADWDDTETPPYHYGTFYSSAMIVASYMVRMEPFTQHFLRLQGGHFDLADRMFHSIHDSWLSASKHNMADIKELVPEFFYLPEFLKNANKYDLGIKQNGIKLDDVVLPPWAKGDTREFIRLHRCALESDYVSAHLHEWIDLIFGYKQQGQPAVDAVNVFHHLFYEGNVDIYNTDIDPIKKNAVIGFINNFGQVPRQLFKKPHPARKVTPSSGAQTSIPLTPILPSLSASSGAYLNQRLITHCPQALKQANASVKDLRGPVGQIVQIDKNIVAVEQNKLLIPPEFCRYIAWGHADRSLRLGLYDSEKPIFVWEGSDHLLPNEILCCTIPNSRTMITAGTEALITVWKIEKMRSFTPISNLYGHVEPITCLVSSQAYSLIVSGSRDRTAIIWDLNRFTFVRQLGGSRDRVLHHGPISAIAINDSTGDIATCASSWLYLWTINGELLAQVDTMSVVIQQSMGGTASMSSNLGQLHILSVCFSQNNEYDLDEVILTGASDGSVAIWSMRYYQSPLSETEIEEANPKSEDKEGSKEEQESENVIEVEAGTEQTTISSATHGGSVEAKEQEEPAAQTGISGASEDMMGETTDNSNVASSEPINITRSSRKRTDTMNSEWVKLSTSSTSTADTIPGLLRATPDGSSTGNLSANCEDLETQPSVTSARDAAQVSYQVTTSSCDEQDNGQQQLTPMTSKANVFHASPTDTSMIKFSKSDTSLVDSFVILGEMPSSSGMGGASNQPGSSNQNQSGSAQTMDRVRPQSSAGVHPTITAGQQKGRKGMLGVVGKHERPSSKNISKLLPNHCWRRELYLRNLLSRRTAKIMPAAVTSLAISKDQKTIYIGDANGRISSWSTA